LNDLEVENELINRNLILSSIVLHGTSQEPLREEELADPVEGRNALVYPVLEEFQALLQIADIAAQGL